MTAPQSIDFQEALLEEFARAESRGRNSCEIRASDLHRTVGGYPGNNHRMPVCCDVMYGEMRDTDEVVDAPPKGKGASLKIRYCLPR